MLFSLPLWVVVLQLQLQLWRGDFLQRTVGVTLMLLLLLLMMLLLLMRPRWWLNIGTKSTKLCQFARGVRGGQQDGVIARFAVGPVRIVESCWCVGAVNSSDWIGGTVSVMAAARSSSSLSSWLIGHQWAFGGCTQLAESTESSELVLCDLQLRLLVGCCCSNRSPPKLGSACSSGPRFPLWAWSPRPDGVFSINDGRDRTCYASDWLGDL